MSSNRVVIFGAGGVAEVVHVCMQQDSDLEVIGFVVDDAYCSDDEFRGLPLVRSTLVTERFPPAECSMFVAMSYQGMNVVRRDKCAWARDLGYQLQSYVSTRATTFGDLRIGDNCLILENNTIQPFVSIGSNVFVWSGNHIGHHSTIGSDVFVSSHCVVSGNCTVGERSFLGVNSTVQDGVRIGEACFVGPTSLVRSDLGDEAVLIVEETPPQRLRSRHLRF